MIEPRDRSLDPRWDRSSNHVDHVNPVKAVLAKPKRTLSYVAPGRRFLSSARVVELVDAGDSKSPELRLLRVRLPPRALFRKNYSNGGRPPPAGRADSPPELAGPLEEFPRDGSDIGPDDDEGS